jgi:hypothetical protein
MTGSGETTWPLELGMHLIGKPFAYAELAAKVHRMLDGA